MRNSWTLLFRRLAAACVVSGATAWSSAMCYAIQLAYDDATSLAYQNDDANGSNDINPANNTNGWQAGDNGGFGFEPWDFTTDASSTGLGIHRVDGVPPTAPSSFNAVGTAWTLGNTTFHTPPPSGDVARAGRGFSPLQVGQTLKVVIDNPTQKAFFRGYFIRFNSRNGMTGGGNICYGNAACTPGKSPTSRLNVRTFEYFTYGQWGVENGVPGADNKYFHGINLFDTDTAAAGAEIDVTLTGPNTYQLTIDPFGAAPAYTESGPLRDPGQSIDWLEFTFFNTNAQPGVDTEFFIRSLEIVGSATPGDYNGDSHVNLADYVTWRRDTAAHGGANGYATWRESFGTAGAGSSLSSSAIPEPSSFASLLIGIVSICMMGLRRLWRHGRAVGQ